MMKFMVRVLQDWGRQWQPLQKFFSSARYFRKFHDPSRLLVFLILQAHTIWLQDFQYFKCVEEIEELEL